MRPSASRQSFSGTLGGKAAAVPFAPISVAAEVEPSQQRVAVVSSAERLDEPFVGFEEDGVVEVRGVLRLCGERGGPGLPPGADADLEGILAGALVEDPFRGVVLGPAAAIHAHDAEGDRKPMPLAAGQQVVEGLPVVDAFPGFELRPGEAGVDGADVDQLLHPPEGRFAAHAGPALSGIAEDGGVLGERHTADTTQGGRRRKEETQGIGKQMTDSHRVLRSFCSLRLTMLECRGNDPCNTFRRFRRPGRGGASRSRRTK